MGPAGIVLFEATPKVLDAARLDGDPELSAAGETSVELTSALLEAAYPVGTAAEVPLLEPVG